MNSACAELVVVIDDNDIDRFINQKVLEFSCFAKNILAYSTGTEALDYLRASTGKDIPDLIFLDLNMPVVDGFEFLDEFSKLPVSLRKRTSLVILSSSNNVRDIERIGGNSNVIKFLSKPLTEGKLEQIRKLWKSGYRKSELKSTPSVDELNG